MKKVLFPILALILVFGLALPMATPAMADLGAEIWTDKPDYTPSETVTILGSGFNTSADVNVTIERPDGIVDPVDALTDDTGSFTCTYQLNGIEGTYMVTATDGTNTATTTFTDRWWSVSVSPTGASVSRGGSTTPTVTVNSYDPTGGPTIDLSATGQPTGVTVSFSPVSGTPNFNSTMTIDVGMTAPLGGHTITIEAKLATAVKATTSFTLTVTEPEAEPTEPEADLSITKSGPEYALVGDEITYTYKVENAGPDSATGVVVEDDVAGTATFVDGDTDDDEELDVGETWTFEASYTVLEEDSDPLENTATVSSDTSDPDEENNEASWSVDILHPGLDVTKEADNTITKEGDTVRFTITVENTGDVTLNLVSFTDTLMGDISANFSATLAAKAKESWYYDRATLAGDPDPLANEAEAHYSITGLPNDITDKSKVEVDLIARICGYKFHDANRNGIWDNGEVGLEGWTIELWLAGSKIAETTTGSDGSYCFDELDAGDYAVKEVGQKNWKSTTPDGLSMYLKSGEISEDNNFGNARLVTRTQGFWSTHKAFTSSKWTTETIGTKTINTEARLFGGFWSNIAKKTTGAKRTALDQARMQLVQQLLATMLNVKAFGDDGLGTGAGLIAAGKAAFAGTDRATILDIANKLDAFNKSGDTQPLPPGVIPGPADPKGAQKIADKIFWDTLP